MLWDEYRQPLEVAQRCLAVANGVPPWRVNEIVRGKRRIIGTSERF
jgi:plasmid maintenance system antidote protein VapI